MEFRCLEKIRPELRVWLNFVNDVTCPALNIDSFAAKTHPIEIVDLDYGNISKYFDSIGYLKGASVIRMLQDLIGQAQFDLAITAYLNKFV